MDGPQTSRQPSPPSSDFNDRRYRGRRDAPRMWLGEAGSDPIPEEGKEVEAQTIRATKTPQLGP